MTGGSASALELSRPAQASLTLRPARLLNRLKRPLSRGSSPAGYPTEPLVSFQINRQLSGWNLPPLMIRAFGAHDHKPTLRGHRKSLEIDPMQSAPGSWQRIGGASPPRGRASQPPRPRVMHEVLLARAAVKRSQGRPRAKY